MSAAKTLTGYKLWIARTLQTFIAVTVTVLIISVGAWADPAIALVVLGLFGQKPMCSNGEVYQGARQYMKQQELKTRITAGMKLLETDPAGYELWDSPMGRVWNPKGSGDVVPIILAQQEMNLYGLGDNGVKPGNIVLDCGAHIGLYARRALRDGAKLVVAIEPAPENVECLRRNLKEEIAAGKVIVYPKGVWDKEEMLPLYANPTNSAGDSFVNKNAEAKVIGNLPLTTIDKIAAELNLPRVDYIKMDIKGAVTKTLSGGMATLRASHPRIAVSTEEQEDDPLMVTNFVTQLNLGYKPVCGSCTIVSGKISPDVVFYH